MAALLEDYLTGNQALLACYAGDPRSSVHEGVSPAPWSPRLAEDIRRYQSHLGAAGPFQGNEGVFITGQQPGIFTGPMYTIYKAITAIKLAAAASESTGEAFVPIYWVGGDDHDYAEIAEAHLLSKGHADVPLILPPSAAQPVASIFRLPVPHVLHDMAELAAAQAPGSEFTAEILAFLHESLDASANLSEWHARLMARLFRDTPLVIFSPDLPEARLIARDVFRHEITHPLESTRRLNEGGARLEAAGYGAQVVKSDDACNFFLERSGLRCRVRFNGDTFAVPDTGEFFSQHEMLSLLENAPETFTANVALRCVVQQRLFPVRAYVAGPGELAYWGQLKSVFAFFETPMPLVYPRSRGVITNLKSNKLLSKLGMDLSDLYGATEELEERALRSGPADPSLAAFSRRARAIAENVAGLRDDFEQLGRGGKHAIPLATQFQLQVQQSLTHLERALLRADENRTATVRNQLERLCTELAPGRKPQERHYSVFSWLFQYGWELIPRISAALDHADFSLQEVEL